MSTSKLRELHRKVSNLGNKNYIDNFDNINEENIDIPLLNHKQNINTKIIKSKILDDSPSILGISMIMINELIYCIYYDHLTSTLKFISEKAKGVFNKPQIITKNGQYPCITKVNNQLGVTYYNYHENSLYFINSRDQKGLLWSKPVLLNDQGDVGINSSLKYVNNKLVVCYYDYDNCKLLFQYSEDRMGRIWSAPIGVIDGDNDCGLYNSLSVDEDNRIIIYYYDCTDSSLKCVKTVDTSFLEWESEFVIDDSGYSGLYCKCVDDKLVYFDANGGCLKYRQRLSDKLWDVVQELDFKNNGRYCNCVFINNRPVVVYMGIDNDKKNLKMITSRDMNGKLWNDSEILDSFNEYYVPLQDQKKGVIVENDSDFPGLYINVTSRDDHIVVVYRNDATGNLKFIEVEI